jgi:hypothetical protein
MPRTLYRWLAVAGMISLFAAALPLFTVKASSQTQTLTPQADAYVDSSRSGDNFGSNSYLRLDGKPTRSAYLRFDLDGLNLDTVQSAKLRIYALSDSGAGYEVRRDGSSKWSETELNFDNAAKPGASVGNSGKVKNESWNEVDVTGAIKDKVKDFALTTGDETQISLAARENKDHAPQLVLVIAGDSAKATATQPIKTKTPVSTPTSGGPTDVLTAVPTTTGGGPTSALTPTAGGPTATLSATPTASTPTPALTTVPSGGYQPSFPIRAAFYYPWFPQAWTQKGITPYTNYNPTLGFYDGGDLATVKKQIDMLQYGGMQAGIASWWGQGSQTDAKISVLLQAAAGTNFRWALYYENESQGDPSSVQITNDLTYILNHYANDPSYLRVNGKPVVFVYADTADGCGMADRWKAGNTVGAYVVLKVFSGYTQCGSQPDGWHQYSPAVATDVQAGQSAAISPGFWLVGNAVRLARDPQRFANDLAKWASANVKWQLVTTFNEWGEGTAVEPAKEWATSSGYGFYLDMLHLVTSGQTAPPPAPTAQPTAGQPAPTAVPTNSPTAVPTSVTSSPTTVPTVAPTKAPSGSNDPIIFFQGDLVSSSSMDRATKVVNLIKSLMAQHVGTPMLVASTGDNEQENTPTLSDYQNYFGHTYATFVTQGIFEQVRGNHDIQSVGGGQAYWDYFGANAHNNNGLTNYSYDLGAWHFTALDELNGSVNSTTLAFLKSDLAAHAGTKCQLVYWHVPTYSSGSVHGDATGLKPLNQAEYDAGVDIQLNGHDHDYQRFLPLNPNGAVDNTKGITTFIDGIGGQAGRSGSKTSIAQAASAVYMDAFPGGSAIGTIMFTLHADSADYALYNANDGTILDHGTVTCH